MNVRTILLLGSLLLLGACSKNENFSSNISFINATIGTPRLQLSLRTDSSVVAGNIGYDSLVQNVEVASGTRSVSLLSGTQVVSQLVTNLEAGGSYTAIVFDSVQKAQYYIRKNIFPTTITEGRCAIRLFNLIPASGALYLADSQTARITGRSFADFTQNSAAGAFIETDTLRRPMLRLDSARTVATLPFPLRPGKMYTLYLTGSLRDTVSGAFKPRIQVQQHN